MGFAEIIRCEKICGVGTSWRAKAEMADEDEADEDEDTADEDEADEAKSDEVSCNCVH